SRISGINVSGRALVGNGFENLDSAGLVAWGYMSSLFSVIGSTYPRTPGDHHIDVVSLRAQGDFSENTPSPQTWYSASGQAIKFGAKASPNTDRLTMKAMDIEAPTIGSL